MTRIGDDFLRWSWIFFAAMGMWAVGRLANDQSIILPYIAILSALILLSIAIKSLAVNLKSAPTVIEPILDIGYVYLIRGLKNEYKIGCTRNLKNRLLSLQTGSSISLKCVCAIETDHMKALEAHLHQRFARKRIHGEWFNLNPLEVNYAKSLRAHKQHNHQEVL